jgi:hypothetical protein
MGYYINPPTETKEEFLKRVGTPVYTEPMWAEIPKDTMLVILIQNPYFSAAAILFEEKEFNAFMDPADTRQREYFYVPKKEVYPYLFV